MAQAKLGSGARFAKLKRILAARRGSSKVRNPGALSASIGDKKYGVGKMAKMAARGRKSY